MIFTSDTPWTDRSGRRVYHLWADEPLEAVPTLYAIGADPDAQRRHECNAFECYWLTEPQWLDALTLGVECTDRWGPTLHVLRREGPSRISFIDKIEATRRLAR